MKTGKLIAIAMIVVALIISVTLIAINWNNIKSEGNTIETTGNSEIEVAANQVSITLAYESRADTAEEAQEDNKEVSNDIIESLKDAGVKDDEIETLSYNVRPEYDWTEDEGRVLEGYIATHMLKVETLDLDKIGAYIDVAMGAGANRIDYINYELTEEEEKRLKDDALEEATENARSKAEAIAKGSGTRITRIITIRDTSYNYYPWRYDIAYAKAEVGTVEDIEIPTQVETGKVTVRADVSAVFEIA